ncbi:hypothetical protein BLS_004153 [Venturia inaequalis]|uniref:Uncharacterized protein n=1 Tax=Venturia inaequalis TaxID=5025 RepID=A0A8H3UL05_VENIN|nr:hypothetical protein BLS_004153 [Venturia inaequalis]
MSSTTAWALLGVVILFISGGITYWVITIYQRKNQADLQDTVILARWRDEQCLQSTDHEYYRRSMSLTFGLRIWRSQ